MNNKYQQTFLHIKNQLPKHFRDNYNLFVKFMEYYYQYLDETVFTRDLENLRNVEKTSSDLYKYIISEFSILPTEDFSNFDFFNSMRSFYLKKGTSDAFKELFQQIYNEKIDVSYPADRTFTLSEGEWIQNTSFFVKLAVDNTLPINDIEKLNGQQINLIAGNNIYSIFVENVRTTFSLDYQTKEKKYSDSFIEIFYTNTNKIPIKTDDIIVANIDGYTFKAITINVVTKYSILNGGYNFKAGEILNCEYNNDNTLLFRVLEVDENGTILNLEILNSSPYIENDVIVDLKHVETLANEITSNLNKLTIVYNKQKRLWTVNLSETFNSVKTFSEKGLLHRNPEGKKTPFGFKEQNFLNMDLGPVYDDKKSELYNKKDLNNILRHFPAAEVAPNFHQYYFDLNKPNSIKETFYNNDYDLQLGKYNFFKKYSNFNARIKLFSSNIIKKRGYYNNNKSFTSDTIFLTGGKYYHSDSYVIHSEHSINDWGKLVKNTIHPAGSEMFSQYLYDINLNIELKLISSLDIKNIWVEIFEKINLINKELLYYHLYTKLIDHVNYSEHLLYQIKKFLQNKISLDEKISKNIKIKMVNEKILLNVEKLLKETHKQINSKNLIVTDLEIKNAIKYMRTIIDKDLNINEEKELYKLIEKYLNTEFDLKDSYSVITNKQVHILENLLSNETLESRYGMYYILDIHETIPLLNGGYIEPYNTKTTNKLLNNDDIKWQDWISIFGDPEMKELITEELNKKPFLLNIKEAPDAYSFGIGIIK